jgi:DNA helicase-2/ATP-dependent DNA helicase PcrA
LECNHVAIIPCDARHFDSSFKSRCLLYVAISRPIRTLTLVLPKNNASPLFHV